MLMSEFPVVSVHIPPVLRTLVGGHEEVMASGETVGDVLRAVGHTYPDFAAQVLCGDGQLAAGLNVYLGGASLRTGLGTPVEQEEVVSIVATGEIGCAVPGRAPNAGETAAQEVLISIGD